MDLFIHTGLDTARYTRCACQFRALLSQPMRDCTLLMSFERQQVFDEDMTPSWPGFDNESDNRSMEDRTNVFCATTSLQIHLLGFWSSMM